jgi:calcium/calmodulin-dependent protein kinase I
LEKLGTGNFSVVKKCRDRETKMMYALKIIDKKLVEGKEEMIETECEILRRVKHPNIVSMVEAFDTEDKLYLVMDLATGGELFERIVAKGSYTELDASRLVKSMLEAIHYLHSLDVVHRDLKPENLLYSDPSDDARIMITDFGLSKLRKEEDAAARSLKTACGTPGYVAPEVLRQRGYGKEVDLWSAGVITYILLCGYPPFYHEDQTQLFELILRGRYEFHSEYWANISDSAKDLVRSLLTVDPSKRATPDQALKHPWIAGEASSKDIMETFKEGLKKNPRQRLQAAVNKVMFINAFKTTSISGGKESEEESLPAVVAE